MKHFILAIFLAVQLGQMAFGAVEKFVSRVDGSSGTLAASYSTPVMTLYDDKYYTMATTTPSSWNFYNAGTFTTLRFGINPDVVHTTSYPNASITLQLNLWKWNPNGGGFSVTTEVRMLSLSNPSTGPTDVLDEISSCRLKGVYKMEIFVTSYSGLPSFNSIYLSAEMEAERYYTLNNMAVTGLNYSISPGNTEQIQFAWDQKWGAEHYELEWCHISNSPGDLISPPVALSNLKYNYYLNSTRVVVKGNTYSIPKVFDAGYIIYRVRPIGLTGSAFNIRKEGVWTNPSESGTLNTHNSNIIPIVGEFQTGMNWVHQVGYDDDGKRFESISYLDGLGKVHQSIAINPETKQSVVSNVYYDQVGRAVVGDLPTPINGIDLTHKEKFNRTEVDNTIPYHWEYFDPENADPCNPNGIGFATNNGAGNYYSTANNTQVGANQRIPDAEKFPFTRQVYTDDFTGRLKSVSGAGATLKTGSGHENQFFYPDVNQYELDKLFGAESGKATHYNKMVTVDANGQIYIQITDMAGRVVASYMAGENPDQLDMIEGNGVVTETVPLLPGNEQSLTTIIPSATFTSLQFITAEAEYDFDYAFTPAEFHNSCMAQNICLDCVYDLNFRILDDCGVIVYQRNEPVNGDELTNMCNDESPHSFNATVPLAVGEYQIVKKLSVNQDAIYRNWCYYINNNSCLDPVSQYFNQEYDLQTFPECTPELEAPFGDECEDYKEMMLRDLTPGGQYAQFTLSGGGYSAIPGSHSIFTNNGLGTGYGYQNPSPPYLDANGLPALVNGTPPQNLSMAAFIQNFQSSWANSLLYLHPEYCYYDVSCNGTSTLSESYDYDNSLQATYTYAEACDAGYFHPLTSNTVPIQLPMSICNGTSGIDPFFATGGLGASYAAAMEAEMANYQSSNYSMWEMAVYDAYCNGEGTITDCLANFRSEKTDCFNDLVWVTFRNMYLETKQGFVYQAIRVNCPSVPSIGVDAGWENYTSIFGNMETLPDMDGDGNPEDGTGLTLSEGQLYLDDQIAQSCHSTCVAYADQWLALLGDCDLTGVNTVALHASLVQLCESGCNSDHPMGSSTSSSGATIQSVLSSYGIPMTSRCTGLLISEPAPYASTGTMTSATSKPLDICACDVILTAEYDIAHGINNPSNFNLEQLIALRTGVSLEDAHYLLCACESVYKDPYDPNAVFWETGSNTSLAASGYSIPATIACKPDNCTDCDEVARLLSDLHYQFSSEPDFQNAANYPIILTNYLNLELGFQLSQADYQEFIAKCEATSENPYCYATPEAEEWISVMKLIAFRGTLTTTSPVNLLTNNIVYASGSLKNNLAGNDYWTEPDGNSLVTYWGQDGGSNCSIRLTLPDDASFGFEDILSFENIAPLSVGCGDPGDFKVTVSYISCGLMQTAELTGISDCFQMTECICGSEGLTLCDQAPDLSKLCYQPRLDEIYQNAWNSYQESVQALYESYLKDYNETCASVFDLEELEYTGPANNYHYTLFYYDQAGNLIKTIAPKGIPAAFDQTNVDAARNSVQSSTIFEPLSTYAATPPFPANTYETTYKYNSYNQLVSTTNPDHDEETQFWYDRLGRLVASQNAVQKADKKYSYVLFDRYGRPVETGQADRDYISHYDHNGTPYYGLRALLDENILKKDDLGAAFKAYIYSCTRTEVTYTVYDKQIMTSVPSKFAAGTQQNIRLRVASVVYFDAVTAPTMPMSGYVSAIHYSYDVHGNVIESLQDVPAMIDVQQDIKSTQYQFQLLSGNVKKVQFQIGERDNMTHEYFYDKANRLTEVFTSTDYGVNMSREAHYRYFDYGPLARVEIGQHKVQGNDYSYTINGWIKSMNGTTIDINRDAGKDGKMGYQPVNQQVNALFAQDVTAYTLGYFSHDYSSIMPTNFLASVGTSNPFANASKNLYNGNIAHTTTAITGFENQASVYTYDQLQRLKSSSVYRSLNNLKNSNNWNDAAYTQEYASAYTYDRNGNIMSLVRKGTNALGLGMDNLTYEYYTGRNQLKKVSDAEGATSLYTDDINDLAGSTHYTYDQIGQLTYNAESNQTYVWRKGDKKLAVQRSATKQLEFVYNPFGQRIYKLQKNVVNGVVQEQSDGNPWIYTYYAYDANGQVMATYKVIMNTAGNVKTAEVNEQMIYGAGRIGLINRDRLIYTNQDGEILDEPVGFYKNRLGEKNYELSNYLGNVNAVITDRKVIHANATAYVFNSNTVDGWTAGSNAGTPVADYGVLKVTTTAGSNNFVQRSFTTVSGTTYQLFIRANKGTAANLNAIVGSTTYALVSGQLNVLTFTASTASTNIRIQPTTTAASSFNIDEVILSSAGLYQAVAIMKADYYPFGMQMPGRFINSDKYRFGYNGMEMDNEAKGNGNSYTTEFRQYDPRLGRWLSLDPLMMKYPGMSPYVAFNDNPIYFTDPLGLEGEPENGVPQIVDLSQVSKGGEDKGRKKPIEFNTDLGTTPKNVKVLETYSCDKNYSITLDDGSNFNLDHTNGDVRRFMSRGTTYEAKYNTSVAKKGQFLGYYDGNGNKFNPTMHYGYATHEFTDDETFNKNLAAAFQHFYDNPTSYGWETDDGDMYERGENYNCYEFALSLTSGREVNYKNIIMNNDPANGADQQLARGYISVDASQAIPGKTIIRFSANNGDMNQADHFAIYLGKNSKGQTIIATKNAKSVQPKIMLLKDLCLQQWQFGQPAPADGDKSAYYNPITP